jgi:glycerol-3-phosphate acyltransferase PlsY
VFHGFRGGKGVATAAGVLLALSPALGLATLATWLGVALVSRYSSLAAIAAAVCAPLYQWLMTGADGVFLAVLAMAALLLWRHQPNIAKLMAGTESRIGSRKSG